jgi:hypothetical protein
MNSNRFTLLCDADQIVQIGPWVQLSIASTGIGLWVCPLYHARPADRRELRWQAGCLDRVV